MEFMIETLGLVAGITMPLFNIPMIMRILKRKSSNDISAIWVMGVWLCMALMLPSALISTDLVFKAFGIVNLALFSFVLYFTLKYRSHS